MSLPRFSPPLQAAFAAGVSCLLWMSFQVHTLYGGNWTGLFYASEERTVAEELRAGAYIRPAGRGYDGQQYRAIAHDPWPPFRLDSMLDSPVFRRQRMLVPSLAWCLALGRREWIDAAYIAAVLCSAALAVWACAVWFMLRDRSAWWGCLALVLPPVVTSVDRMGVDATLLALAMGAAVLMERGRWTALWIVLALAGLTRETGILLCTGAALWTWLQGRVRLALALLSAAAPALAWMGLLAVWLNDPQPKPDFRFLYSGIFAMLGRAEAGAPLALRLLNTVGLIGLAASIPAAVRYAWRGGAAGALVALYIPLALVLGGSAALENPTAYGRQLGPLFAFVLFESIIRREWWWTAAAGAVCAGPLAYSLAAFLRGLGLLSR